jgi:hypothetical protein
MQLADHVSLCRSMVTLAACVGMPPGTLLMSGPAPCPRNPYLPVHPAWHAVAAC